MKEILHCCQVTMLEFRDACSDAIIIRSFERFAKSFASNFHSRVFVFHYY